MRPRVFPAEDDVVRRLAADHVSASMRPRVFPAEDVMRYAGLGAPVLASMRPRVFPAEDAGGRCGAGADHLASMRPRVFPAEDMDRVTHNLRVAGWASMRPRVFPAEDLTWRPTHHSRTCSGFNEAAGIPRGRLEICGRRRQSGQCFNEAAGIPRGRPPAGRGHRAVEPASMRPRVFPAEDNSIMHPTSLRRWLQ